LENRNLNQTSQLFRDEWSFVAQWPFNSTFKMSAALLQHEGH